jgi:hypothetical protein
MSGSFKGGVLVPNDRSLRLVIDVAAAQYGDRLQRRHVRAEQDVVMVRGTASNAPATPRT